MRQRGNITLPMHRQKGWRHERGNEVLRRIA